MILASASESNLPASTFGMRSKILWKSLKKRWHPMMGDPGKRILIMSIVNESPKPNSNSFKTDEAFIEHT
jgi:hypothetical protein